jgi:hypothetical protein
MTQQAHEYLAEADRLLDLNHPHGGPHNYRMRIAQLIATAKAEAFEEAGWLTAAQRQRRLVIEIGELPQ